MTLITPMYAALIGLLFIVLSQRVIKQRQRARVALGDGNDEGLMRAMRVHANCAEYAPLALILILCFELLNGSGWWVHALGAALVAGRVLHAFGVSNTKENFTFRISGMIATFAVIAVSAVGILVSYFL